MTDQWTLEKGKLKIDETLPPYDPSKITPDPTNQDTTDWPRKGCRQCGKRDRPQYKGTCNDDHCSQG